jgi:predicted Zn-dependent peptidase
LGVEKQILDNGLRIIYLPIAGVHSASVGIWVATGSRYETEKEQGISHFIEHMFFKGTTTRNSREISEEMDFLGGGLNAYTAREYTRYYAHTLAENAVKAMDILCDMIMNPLIDKDELERERLVILDEMAMYQDSGEDVAYEKLCAAIWPNSSLGRPIAGIADTVSSFTAEDLRNYINTHYTPERMVAVIAGGFDRDGMDTLLKNTLGKLERGSCKVIFDNPIFQPSISITNKKFEQTSLSIAMPGLPKGDPRRYAMMVLNFIVGGGSSSRLFQRLREELGLAYSVYSSHSSSTGTGLFTVSASFSSDRQDQVLFEINNLLDGIADGVTAEEFERARAQIKAANIIGLETVAAKASFAGHNELFQGRQITGDEVLENLNKLTLSDVNQLASTIFGNSNRALSVAGNTKERSFYQSFIPVK